MDIGKCHKTKGKAMSLGMSLSFKIFLQAGNLPALGNLNLDPTEGLTGEEVLSPPLPLRRWPS